jgi:hypothetical protein
MINDRDILVRECYGYVGPRLCDPSTSLSCQLAGPFTVDYPLLSHEHRVGPSWGNGGKRQYSSHNACHPTPCVRIVLASLGLELRRPPTTRNSTRPAEARTMPHGRLLPFHSYSYFAHECPERGRTARLLPGGSVPAKAMQKPA